MPETDNPSYEHASLSGTSHEQVSLNDQSAAFGYDDKRNEIILRTSPNSEDTPTEKRHPFQDFLYGLRNEGIRVSTSEWLDLQKVLASGRVQSLSDLYTISRALLVKTSTGYPRYERVFGKMFYGLELPDLSKQPWEEDYDESQDQEETQPEQEEEQQGEEQNEEEPEEQDEEKEESEEENQSQEIVEPGSSEEHHGGTDVHKAIKDSQSSGHEGGGKKSNRSKSPGEKGTRTRNQRGEEGDGEKQHEGKGSGLIKEHKKAKDPKELIQQRRFDQLDRSKTLSYDQFDLALAKLTSIIEERTGVPTHHLDIDATVESIAARGGMPEFIWREENEGKPHVLLFFDVGGSTDEFRPIMEKLFAAAKDRLDEVEVFYFHNAIYGQVWPQSDGNWGTHFIPMEEILKKGAESKVIIVGDAWMADYELFPYEGEVYDQQGDRTTPDRGGVGSFEDIRRTFEHSVWINPILEKYHEVSDDSGTIARIKQIFPMYDLSLEGIERAVTKLMDD